MHQLKHRLKKLRQKNNNTSKRPAKWLGVSFLFSFFKQRHRRKGIECAMIEKKQEQKGFLLHGI